MIKFKVTLTEQNFDLDTEDGVRRIGFYTVKIVNARTAKEAERLAIGMIRNDQDLQEITLNDQSNPPQLYVVEIEHTADVADFETLGLSFYPEEED